MMTFVEGGVCSVETIGLDYPKAVLPFVHRVIILLYSFDGKMKIIEESFGGVKPLS